MAVPAATKHADEIATRDRFEFGRNWSRFLRSLTPENVRQSENALAAMLGRAAMAGRSFLDLGSGSGLSSLAARNLGATVVSVDYDPGCVACAEELKARFWKEDAQWRILEGSALDRAFLRELGRFDIVYSWGVLHHTGAMWQALENVVDLVEDGGTVFLAIYNDQGGISRRWLLVKKLYNRMPRYLRFTVLVPCLLVLQWRPFLKDILRGKPLSSWRTQGRSRGMSAWTDLVDWVGGYPFEVAKPEQVFRLFRDRGFSLRELRTNGGSMGCNEFVFIRTSCSGSV
jgi:2-polyprenyl-6-hydroxyphenyl methylase/3-demethylubiquinone-9 3-methyltransferase